MARARVVRERAGAVAGPLTACLDRRPKPTSAPMIFFGLFGLYMIFSGPKQYDTGSVYKIDHQVNHRTHSTDYKTGAQIQSEELGRFTGQAIFGVLVLGLAALFGYGLRPEKRPDR